MTKLKRLLSIFLALSLTICLFPALQTPALASDTELPFSITDTAGNAYTPVLTDLVDASENYTSVYYVQVPDGFGSLNVTSTSGTLDAGSCGCNHNMSSADSGTPVTLTITEAGHNESACFSTANKVAGWDKYVDKEATVIFAYLYNSASYDPMPAIMIQVGGKTTSSDAPFSITDAAGNAYTPVLTDLVDASENYTSVYYVQVPDGFGSLNVTSTSGTLDAGSCGCNHNMSSADSGTPVTLTITEAGHNESACFSTANKVAGWDKYVDKEATVIFAYLYNSASYDPMPAIMIQVGGKTDSSKPPVLSAVENGVDRTSDTSATVKFTSDQAGTYYYAWNDADASEPPTISTSGSGTAMAAGENIIELSALTAGAKKLYIMAKSTDGKETADPLVLDIPAFVRPTHTLTISFTPGDKMAGYKVLSVTADGAPVAMGKYGYTVETGAVVVVRVLIPDGKKVLESVTLARTDDAAETFQAKVDGSANSFSFTMPDADTRFKSYTLKDADASNYRYNLSFKATLLWEEQGDQEKNRKGNVVFQNAAGETVSQAKQGEKITAKAIPRTDDIYYKFAFSRWESATEGVTLPTDTTAESFTFTMPANDVTLGAAFINVGTEISWKTVPAEADTTVEMIIFGNKQNPYTYRKTSEGGERGAFNCIGTEWGTRYRFDHWEIYRDDVKLSDADIDTTQAFGTLGQPGYYTVPKFDIEGGKMEIVGVFEEKSFAAVTVSVTPEGTGTASAAAGTESATDLPIVFEGQTVTLTAAPADRYKLESWTVTAPDNTVIATTPDENDENKVTFVMPTFETPSSTVTAEAHFVIDQSQASGEKALSAELLAADRTSLGDKCTYSKEGGMLTFTLAPDVDTSDLSSMILKLTCSDYATVKRSGDDENWPAEGKACNMTLGQEVTFIVTAENGDTATYTIKIVQQKLSSEAEISRVELLNGNDTFAFGTPDDTLTCTITLKDNIDSTLLSKIGVSDDVKMKITYTGASLAQADGYDDAEESSDKWSSGNVTCAIKPGDKAKFTVKAEDGTTKVYTIAITKPNVSEKPVLEEVSVNRTSAKEATVKFTSSAAGNYYYKVVESGAAKPDIDTSKGGTNAVADVNTIELSNLTKDARDIYIVVKNAAGDVSEPLKIAIPAYDEEPDTPDEGDFTITYTGPTGGKLVPSRTRANAGDVITVTAVPDAGMQMVAGSMKYTLGVAGGESTTITDGTFTMPNADVTLSCKWEAVKTSTDGITGFVIDGVAGVVDNTTNTISVVMAYGTDVTKLIPIISGNNIASISPASGQMVDFTTSVRYTVTLTDGTVKYYTVTVYVQEGTAADKMWDKLTDFYDQTPWWEYAEHQTSTGRYPKYW